MNKKNVREIIDKLTNAEHAYYVLNDPIMSDGEYDKLFNSLKLIEQDHPDLLMEDSPTQRVTETPSDAFEPVEHQRRMYSFCLLYTSPSPRDLAVSRMPSSA